MKIKIVSNYQSEELYLISKSFYEKLDFEKIGINGSNGFYGIKLLNYIFTDAIFKDTDWVIYIDEDCFIVDCDAMLSLLNHQIKNNIHCSGIPDGGVIKHRQHNPVSINMFFSILNVGEIRKKYDYVKVNQCGYGFDLSYFTPHHLINKSSISYDEFEPYYKFFFWLLRNDFEILYLDGSDYMNDNYTTIVKNHENVDIGYHTWFAREYNTPKHGDRIKNVINYCKNIKR